MKLLSILALCAAFGGGGENDPPTTPDIRIKPAVTVRGLHVTIGDLCEITPMNAQTLAISQIRFGPAPVNGFSRAVSRTDVVQALAAAGVQLKTVKINGGNEVLVQGISVDVPQQDLLDAATAALQAQLALEGGDVEFEPPIRVRHVKAPPGRVSQDLRARVRGTKTNLSSATVDVEILVDGEVFKKVPLRYKLQRFHRVLKTTGTIAKDQPLGPDNLVVAREPMAQASGLFLDRMAQIAGMSASRNLRPNQRLTLSDIAPPAVIRKGDIVTVVLTRGRVKVTAKAMANEDAPLEGRIRLTNMNSRTQLTGIVHGPGLVVVTP
ncbi:MAG: flagellar basal body P-ring formation protein FlgA [Planctomycetes bacterium]|nr:flagellar basal body P-ring formation protein FlgA [Planctomycetota bacterium]